MAEAVTPRAEDYAQWYNDVVRKGQLADNSPARGCMIILPNGMASGSTCAPRSTDV